MKSCQLAEGLQIFCVLRTVSALRTRIKSFAEILFWQYKRRKEGVLGNSHYRFFYTDYFGLKAEDYLGKSILDIGCGPRGSLEWADMASERVGLDPLANSYLKLGADRHKMQYVHAPSEAIPFPDNHFDFVCSFNSLDHVENLEQSCREINRVLKPGGSLLLIVDIHRQATLTEPHALPWNLAAVYFPELEILREEKLSHKYRTRIYDNLREKSLAAKDAKSGVLVLQLRKRF